MHRFALPALLLALPASAADFEVKTPYVTRGEIEVEHKGFATFDSSRDKRNNQAFIAELGYGVTDWWRAAVEVEWEREEGRGTRVETEAASLENVFQLTPRGKYAADLGFLVELERGIRRGAPEEIKFGPIVAKEWGPTLTIVDLFFEKELGRGADAHVNVNYRLSSRWAVAPWLEPGLELHGEPGPAGHFLRGAEQEHRLGPVVYGALSLPQGWGKLQYQLGYLVGLTRATPDGTLKWLVEYELAF